MTKHDKAVLRFCRVPPDLSFPEYYGVLKGFGFELDDSGGGSHVTFFNATLGVDLTMPKPHGKKQNSVGRFYIRKAITLLKEHGFIEDETDQTQEPIATQFLPKGRSHE